MVGDSGGMGRFHPLARYDSAQSHIPKGWSVMLNSIGHLVIGVVAIAGVVTLAALGDVSGSAAVADVLAIAGVSLGIGAATNANPPLK